MTSVETIADRCEIEVLRAEFTDAGLMRDYDRFASLFTPDGVCGSPASPISSAERRSAPGSSGCTVSGTTSSIMCTPELPGSRATPHAAVPTSRSSGASATADRY